MADNLTISIGADTSKMRADLALLQAELKAVGKDLAAAAKAGDVASVNQLAASYESVRKQSLALSGALKVQTTETVHASNALKEFIHSGRGLSRIFGEFSTLSRGVESLSGMVGSLTGGFTAGLFGVAVTRGFAELLTALDEVDKKLLEIRDTARQTNLTPLAVQASQEIAKQAGESADVATKAITRVNALVEAARTKMPIGGIVPTARGGADDPTVLRGQGPAAIAATGNAAEQAGKQIATFATAFQGGVQVWRAGQKVILDLSDPIGMLNLHLEKYRGDAAGAQKSTIDVYKAFQQWAKVLDPTQLNALSKALFDTPAKTMQEIIPALMSKLQKEIGELEQSSAGATNERLESIKQLRIAQNETDTQFKKMMGTIDDMIRPARIAWNEFLKSIFTDVPKTAEEVAAAQGIEPWRAVVEPMKQAFAEGFQWVQDAFAATLDRIKAAASAVKGTLSSSFPGDPSIPAMPMAGGGMIRGPGTGTSDSILARLSNGEFVMRASAVRAWGADFMRSINSFSAGGLVRPVPRFAEGGMVAAGGGTPVHLHLGGHSFALSGNNGVVSALVVEAQRQQMRSAGVKPSWFAARPGG